MSDSGLAGDPGNDRIDRARRAWRLRYAGSDALTAALALGRAEQIARGRVNALLAPLDLNDVRYEILGLLSFGGEPALPLGRIGEWLAVAPTSVTNNVERLEAQGYVRREPHPTDRRATLTIITSSGREVFERASTVLIEARFGLSPLSEREIVELGRILRRLESDV